MLNTPVLFLIFNRPDTTATVFETIRQAKPKQLFVAADGPRLTKEGEKETCEAARKIATTVDWDCEVKTLFREENKGCGLAVSEAITWFFEHVEEGIILEDDVLVSPSFFRFCAEVLEKYKNDSQVMHITATNLFSSSYTMKESYLFSMYHGVWGWATWRRAWNKYDFNIDSWRAKASIEKLKANLLPGQFLYIEHLLETVSDPVKYKGWSYQWIYYRLLNGGLNICPSVNLAINIGFSEGATHTTVVNDGMEHMVLEEMHFPLVHPNQVAVDKKFDLILSKRYAWMTKGLIKRGINKVSRILGLGIKL